MGADGVAELELDELIESEVAKRGHQRRFSELLDDQVGRLLGAQRGRVDVDLGILRRLVRAVDAGEVLELAGARLRV